METEKEHVIKTFKSNFSKYRDKNIVLYGIGLNTKTIVEACEDYNIIGLMDPNKVGEVVFGKKILAYDEVIQLNAEIIVVVARSSSAKIIFRRIKNFCEENELKLNDIKGNNLFELFGGERLNAEMNTYFKLSKQQLLSTIDKYEKISFDIFDTLIMRNVLYPQDIFELVAARINTLNIIPTTFVTARIDAERQLLQYTNPTIDEIYEKVGINLGIDDRAILEIKNLELQTELEGLIARQEMVDVLNYAISSGKQVTLISDMYLPKNILHSILKQLNITGYHELLVSCEYRTSKTERLFQIYKGKVIGRTYLHIGDNPDADGSAAEQNGIHSYLIKSAVDMLEISKYQKALNLVNSINDRSLLGLFIANIFNSPFALYNTDGRPTINTTYEMGYLFIAPLLVNFNMWLIEQLSKDKYDYILFSARDGYLPLQLYEQTISLTGNNNLPQGIYFLTSRMACISASMLTEEDIEEVSLLPFSRSPEELLRVRFRLSKEEIIPYNPAHFHNIVDYGLYHKEKIFMRSMELRQNYQLYIKALDIKNENQVAFFDFVSKGTCQMYLNDLLPSRLKGLYFLHYLSDSYRGDGLDIQSLFLNGFAYKSDSYVFENYTLLETIVTAPTPSLAYFNKDGKPKYVAEEREESAFAYLKEMQQAILRFNEQYLKSLYVSGVEINRWLTDVLFEFSQTSYTNSQVEYLGNLYLVDPFNFGDIKVSI